ncbi:TolC family protein [Flavobacterium sp. P4023]|uniref:TolC family protein n=1 Tax=Flavobacterium flabelliforme TaxID=2816119 RepID=A0ABS5CWT5_9FLAO|nr:TolC family protein [Flavobacterium flabelliforme]MBP4143066.1 TolC family protein [Flavobacterium flabelliforme]
MKKRILLILLFVISIISNAQETLTLEDCYALATKNYPLAKQKELLQQKSNYEIDAITKGKLPKIDLNAQATYQSDVIGFPSKMPGVNPINKDQYRATLDINQLLYNGGMIEANSELKQAQTKTQQQQIEVSLYQLKTRIHQYYFSILLLQEKSELLKSKKELLQSKVQEVKSGVKYGAILPASELILEAELLKIKQQLTEIDFEKIKMTQNLSDLTFTKIDTQTILLVPNSNLENNRNNRPEIVFYNLQKQQLEFSKKTLATSVLPKINAFAQAGYGNPGLNMLDNSFQPFYIAGLKANWTILDWGKNKTDLKTLDIAKEIIETEKETFELNNKMQLREIESEIGKTKQLLELDNNIIHVREKIVTSANAQMKNGVITTSEYLNEFSNLYEAKNSLKTHEVQLAAAKSSYEITNGK